MNKTNKKKINIYILLQVVITVAIVLYGYYLNSEINNVGYKTVVLWFSWISLGLLIWGIISWIKITNGELSPYLFIIGAFFVFHLGQPLLYIFHFESPKASIFNMGFSFNEIFKAIFYSCICFNFLHLGAIIQNRKSVNKVKYKVSKVNSQSLKYAMKLVGYIMLIVSFVPYYYYLTRVFNYGVMQGYSAVYENTLSLQNIGILQGLFIPSILIMMVIYKRINIIRFIGLLVIFVHVLIMLAAGWRGEAVALLISFIVFWNLCIKKFDKKQIFILCLAGIIMISILPIIFSIRSNNDKSLLMFLDLFLYSIRNDNLIFTSISEMGFSIYPLLHIIRFIENGVPILYGTSYLGAIIDSIFPAYILHASNFGWIVWLAQWLQNSLNMSYGPGFSMAAESFFNFGWYGAAIFFIWGRFIIKLVYIDNFDFYLRDFKTVFMCISLFQILMIIRGQFIVFIQNYFYYNLLPMLLIYFIAYQLTKKSRKIEKLHL